MAVYQGDSLEVLKTLDENSIDSLVTDPPAGISFMGKKWDSAKSRFDFVMQMEPIFRECLRVMKPGAHGLVWGLPKTSHWTATALENAGFEVRDKILHLFGSGFPKSLDVSKAIDKMYGVEREVIGISANDRPNSQVKGGRSFDRSLDDGQDHEPLLITKATSFEAKKWQGFGTALKPSTEEWILVRKPLSEKTVAKNCLRWGTGALNIDASRIGTHTYSQVEWNKKGLSRTTGNAYGKHEGSANELPSGRFPSNLVLSHTPECELLGEKEVKQNGDQPEWKVYWDCPPYCAVRMLDEQSLANGIHGAGKKRNGNESKQTGEGALFGVGNHEGNGVRFGDHGGASRFFKCFSPSAKADIEDEWNVNTVKNNLNQQKNLDDFVLSLAVIAEDQEDNQLRSLITLFTIEMQTELKKKENYSTSLMKSIAKKFLLELKHIENLSKSHAKNVTIQNLTDTTMIILSHLTSDGFVENVISQNTQTNMEHGEKVSRKNRFIYCAKASKRDRNAGLEGMEEKSSTKHDGGDFHGKSTNSKSRTDQNFHPTVKNTRLMEYLIKLITPPNGVVLDCFMGSGSTGVAAKRLGFGFVGIEKEPDYFEIAKRRIENEGNNQ